MSESDYAPKCLQDCKFPEGVVPYRNCDGLSKFIVGATDKTGLPDDLSYEEIEKQGKPVDIRVCGNAAMIGVDPFTAKRLKSIEDL